MHHFRESHSLRVGRGWPGLKFFAMHTNMADKFKLSKEAPNIQYRSKKISILLNVYHTTILFVQHYHGSTDVGVNVLKYCECSAITTIHTLVIIVDILRR